MSNIFAEFLRDIEIVIRDDYNITQDERQLAENDGDDEHALAMDAREAALGWVLELLECDYPEELYERYGELLEVPDEGCDKGNGTE